MTSDSVSTPTRMPGRPGLTFEAYKKAYLELASVDGTPPSQRQLRKYLGTGSNTTLALYRRRIAEERITDEKPLEVGSLDAELLATVQRLASQIALDEAQIAEDRVDELQKEAEQRVSVAETTMEKRLQDTAVLEHRATTAEQALQQLQKSIENKDAALKELTNTHHDVKAENASLSQALSDANRQITTHVGELRLRQELLDSAKTKLNSVDKEAKNALAESQREVSELNATLAVLSEKYSGLSDRHKEQLVMIANKDKQQQLLQARIDKANDLREATLAQLECSQGERDALGRQCGELTVELEAEKRLQVVLNKRLDDARREHKLLVEQLQTTISALSAREDTAT